jgi:hypothetical protein
VPGVRLGCSTGGGTVGPWRLLQGVLRHDQPTFQQPLRPS